MKSDKTLRKLLLNGLRMLPLLVILTAAGVFLLSGKDVSVETILSYTPENYVLAALFLLLLYPAKSLTVFFPLAVLFAAGGVLFPVPAALAVNGVGLAAAVSLPYWIGRLSGSGAMDRLAEKYPKVSAIRSFRPGSDLGFSVLTRAVAVLPADIVSLYMGIIRLPYGKFLLGSLLGCLPDILTITLIGASAADPTSPLFIVSCTAKVIIVVISILLCRRMQKKKG